MAKQFSRPWRELVRALVGIAVLAIVIRTWLIEGLVVPVIVSSGSMAPHLLGPHRAWQCEHCGQSVACDHEPRPSAAIVPCANCGGSLEFATGEDRTGDRVLVDRSALLWRTPRRWEMVVFDCPEEPGALCVKRVVGLPGETVQIRNGDVFIDDKLATKNLAETRALAIPVHEPARSTATEPCQRWRAEPLESWKQSGGRFTHPISEPKVNAGSRPTSTATIDWLVYHHQACTQSADASHAGAILDDSPYDPLESRVLNVVTDVTLRCRIRAAGRGTVYFHVRSGGDEFSLELPLGGADGAVMRNRKLVAHFPLTGDSLLRQMPWEVVLADHRLILARDGHVLLAHDFEPLQNTAADNPLLDKPAVASVFPWGANGGIAIGAQDADLEIQDLEVLRDIYYTPGPAGANTVYRLGPDEYFLLGDNSPHSLDSRSWWPRTRVFGDQIVGRALRW